jgi:hypothetical protein
MMPTTRQISEALQDAARQDAATDNLSDTSLCDGESILGIPRMMPEPAPTVRRGPGRSPGTGRRNTAPEVAPSRTTRSATGVTTPHSLNRVTFDDSTMPPATGDDNSASSGPMMSLMLEMMQMFCQQQQNIATVVHAIQTLPAMQLGNIHNPSINPIIHSIQDILPSIPVHLLQEILEKRFLPENLMKLHSSLVHQPSYCYEDICYRDDGGQAGM